MRRSLVLIILPAVVMCLGLSSSSAHGQPEDRAVAPSIRATWEHDIDFKIKQAERFLKHKDKVQVSVMFRGRENAHHEMGRQVLEGIVVALEDVAKVEKPPAMEGPRNMSLVVAPK